MEILEKKQVVSTLVQQAGLVGLKANFILALDKSVSIMDLYENGTMQAIAENAGAVALALDIDGKLPVWIFSDNITKIAVDMTADNYAGFINTYTSEIEYGGTAYTPVIKAAMQATGAKQGKEITYMKEIKSKGFLGFGAKDTSREAKETIRVGDDNKPMIPTVLLMITDGDNDNMDKNSFRQEVVLSSKFPLFIACLGVEGKPKPTFGALKEVDTLTGRFIDNVSFATAPADKLKTMDIKTFTTTILSELLTKYIPTARKQFLIKT